MRVYKVDYTNTSEGSLGSTWHASRREAERQAKVFCAGNQDSGPWASVEAVDFEPTKREILRLLNVHAAHPDNG